MTVCRAPCLCPVLPPRVCSHCCVAADRPIPCAGFNWKLIVTIYLLLEALVVGQLQPRVYKKFGDTLVETAAKTLLIAVLVCCRPHSLIPMLLREP